MNKSKKLDKKGVKNLVKNKGFFCSLEVDTEKNAPAQFADQIPEGAMYFEGIASDGALNRNGYIIRISAFKKAIDDFVASGVILLQHDLNSPIGNPLWGKITKNGLAIGAYVFDDLTGGLVGKNLLRAISTGTITKAVEFENEKTGEIITEEEYRAKRDSGEIGWNDTTWILAVTQLELVEASLVSVGSNRTALITKHDAIETYLKNGAITENGIAEILAKNGEEGEEKKENELSEESAKKEDDEEHPEEKEEEESSKNEEKKAEEAETEKVKISEEDKKKLDDAAKVARETLESLEKAQAETEVDDGEEEKKGEGDEENKESEAENAEEEEKPEEAEEKPAEPEAENAEKPKEEEEKSEPESEKKEPEEAGKDGGTAENKFDVPVEVKTAINSIVAENTSLRAERDEARAKVAKFEAAPDKKGLIYSSQFGGGDGNAKKPEAEKKPVDGKSAVDFLRSNGVEVE